MPGFSTESPKSTGRTSGRGAQRFGAQERRLPLGGSGRRLQPALQVGQDKVGQCGNPARMLVQTGNDVIVAAAGELERALRLDGELLERLEAVGDEAGCHHVDAAQLLPS